MEKNPLDPHALAQLFTEARTYNSWSDRKVDEATLRQLYALVSTGPTTANSNPGRFVFIRSAQARERLRPHLSAGNLDKTMSAPVCVIVAYDTQFYEFMPQLFPGRDFSATFAGKDAVIADTATRSSTLAGAYLILAARALGLDTGPMSGFNKETLDAEFFPDGRWKSNFLCNIGYGTQENLFPRNPRLAFEQACLDL
ncbi:putative malonic semialdehyde reductase RutE [Novosphingobium sp. CECT 9465]|nr:malonic semialdehyde reductase [Novosphingobium sp. CECT 9465]CAH0495334.1 putative malonic semialdehyde reductase RutE [Novosphingobium sp. CECT 9465]